MHGPMFLRIILLLIGIYACSTSVIMIKACDVDPVLLASFRGIARGAHGEFGVYSTAPSGPPAGLVPVSCSERAMKLSIVIPVYNEFSTIEEILDRGRAVELPGIEKELVLVDAKVAGQLGGTGTTFDWRLVDALAKERSLLLAGGLGPDNVADAVTAVRPWGVDVASGVALAGEPRRKDPEKVARFVERVRAVS